MLSKLGYRVAQNWPQKLTDRFFVVSHQQNPFEERAHFLAALFQEVQPRVDALKGQKLKRH